MATAMPKGQPLYIILLGKTGHGKSALGNTILQDDDMFKSEPSPESVTQHANMRYNDDSGRQLYVIDTPGTMDTKYPERSLEKLKKALDFSPMGFHAFLIVLRFGTRMTPEERDAIAILERAYGPKLMEYAIVTFTHGDNFRHEMRRKKTPKKDFKEYILENDTGYLKDLIVRCGNRCVIINSHAEDLESEAAKIVQEVDRMIKDKHGQPFIPKFVGDEECFPGSSLAITDEWTFTPLAKLQEGQKVKAYKDGRLIWSQVFMFGHSSPEVDHIFLHITTTSRSLKVSPGHHVFVSSHGKLLTKAARDIIPGDTLLVYEDHANTYREEDVQQICQKEDKGLFAPITLEGNMVVDGVLASCYVDLVPPPLAHKLLLPLRAMYRVSPSTLQSVNKMGEDGIPRWARWVINNIL